jgi:hypothetical protein
LPAKLTDDRHWLFVEDGFTLAREHELESLFAIGNGYVGSRGSLAEGSALSSPATFVAGVFDSVDTGQALAPMVDWTRLSFAIDGYPLRLDKGHNLEHRAFSHCGKAFWREWRQDRHPREQRSICRLAADGEARQAFGAPWRADVILDTVHAAGRSIDAALDSYIASRSTAILVMWAYRHTRIRHVWRATKSVLARPPLPGFPVSSYRHWPSSVRAPRRI